MHTSEASFSLAVVAAISLRRSLCWIAIAALCLAPTAASAHRCTGDCNASDTVTVPELVVGVRIALGELPLDVCPQFDADFDNRVSINELFVAVNNLFSYCGHGSPPTPTSTRTPTRTPTPTAIVEDTPITSTTPTATATPRATATSTAIATATATTTRENPGSACRLPLTLDRVRRRRVFVAYPLRRLAGM